MRKVSFVEKEFYHIYNRGVDKRTIFSDQEDFQRFTQSINEFNTLYPIGSIYENRDRKRNNGSSTSTKDRTPLVNFIGYCINPNHYHFILEQVSERGIEKFMHRLGTGYTKYFNTKYKRTGSLFQGRFKSKHIDSNKYLLHLSVYINLNNEAHKRGGSASTFSKSSWDEYLSKYEGICKKDIVLGQFVSTEAYKKFALDSLQDIIERKINIENFENEIVEVELP